ncbi:MAG TPA: NADH-quinone oxidoreductase subunit N, partial [Thermoleophilia bacterium]|nr:NADH-quinone oxidoreductase subunit N [Thermoleophilia bacterium]
MLTLPDLVALLPLLAIAAVAVALMVTIAFVRRHRTVLALTLVGLAATLATLPVAATADQPQVTALLRVDAYALFFIGLLALATGAVALLAYGYLHGGEAEPPEFYLLLFIALLGAATMTASTHFASFFLGLEILSVSLYTLIAYPRVRLGCIEASVKYLILGGVTSAFLLFGMALFYAAAGTMTVPGLTAVLNEGTVEVAGQAVTPDRLLVLTGLALILVSVGFKLALVPFHMWTPDIYQGAPAPVTAFVATVSKGATVALLVRYFRGVDLGGEPALFWAFALLAGASMIAGNLLALMQTNVKRLLAYSSIAHLGYVLVAFLASGALAVTAASFYVVVYVAANLIALGIVTVLSGAERDAEEIADYRGLAVRRPWLAGGMALALFSLAGLPLTAGFIGKFYLVRAGAGEALWALVIVLVLTSALSMYYYARVIVAMYVQRPEEVAEAGAAEGGASPAPSVSPAP